MIAISLFIVTTVIAVIHGRAVDARSVAVDSYGNRIFLIRQQKNPMTTYPHRAMMITGLYQPPHHRASDRQATRMVTQGNTVSSDAYLGANVLKNQQQRSESIDIPEISSAEAKASQGSYETPYIDEKLNNPEIENEDEMQDEKSIFNQQTEKEKDEDTSQNSTAISVTEDPDASTKVPEVSDKGVEHHSNKAKKPVSKGKKTKNQADCDSNSNNDNEYEDDDYDDDDDDDKSVHPSTIDSPWKHNRHLPLSRNYFPMVFSFPKSFKRGSASEYNPPGTITAIANSYSTGAGGVASSVATAYGASPDRKKLRKSHKE